MIKNFFRKLKQYRLFFYIVFRLHNARIDRYRKTGEWVSGHIKFDEKTIVRYEAGKPGFILGEENSGREV